jgi:prevent-host-death family protein
MATKIMPISDLRRNAGEVLAAMRDGGDVIYITQHGRPAAVLVDYEQYEAMLAQLEDLADLTAIDAAADEPERDYVEFLAEIGRSDS